MAHELDLSNSRANMAFAGETPWHGLGVKLNPDASLETWMEQAGYNWEVKKAPIQFQPMILGADGQEIATDSEVKVPNRWALYRSDTLKPLSVMSSNYHITQPKDVAEFFRELVTVGGFKMETMGMLRGGATYWALARVDDSADIGGGDVVNPYLLLATSCDGTLSNCATFTTVRVVCQNTLNWSLGADGHKSQIRIPHSTKFNPERVKAELNIVGGQWQRFKKEAAEMAKREVSQDEAVKYFLNVLYPKSAAEGIDLKATRPALEALTNIYENGIGQDTKSARGTAWGLLNAVTRFADHERKSGSKDNRLQAAWFGATRLMKDRAVNEAMKLVA